MPPLIISRLINFKIDDRGNKTSYSNAANMISSLIFFLSDICGNLIFLIIFVSIYKIRVFFGIIILKKQHFALVFDLLINLDSRNFNA